MARSIKLFTETEKQQMQQMAFDQCQDKTIAHVLDCDVKTLKKHFSTVLQKKRAEGKAALRRAQMKLAENNPTMSIFLGKNYLEQKDKSEHELSPQTIADIAAIVGVSHGKRN